MYQSPNGINIQRDGDKGYNITIDDAVVIMKNQQNTIDDLIKNNQRMYQYIQEVQKTGSGPSNYHFSQQNVADPFSVLKQNERSNIKNTFETNTNTNTSKPMTLEEFLAKKKMETSSNNMKTISSSSSSSSSDTESDSDDEDNTPVFNEVSKSQPEVYV